MTPKMFLEYIVDPGLKFLTEVAAIPSDDRARALVMAICGQESAWEHRLQIGGPARSFGQFERYGGVAAVFERVPQSIKKVCDALSLDFNPDRVYELMAWNDMLACAMWRLNLWRDPSPLPEVGAVEAAWEYYRRIWAPGAPHPESWPNRYQASLDAIQTPAS